MSRIDYRHLHLLNWGLLGVVLIFFLMISVSMIGLYNSLGESNTVWRNLR